MGEKVGTMGRGIIRERSQEERGGRSNFPQDPMLIPTVVPSLYRLALILHAGSVLVALLVHTVSSWAIRYRIYILRIPNSRQDPDDRSSYLWAPTYIILLSRSIVIVAGGFR